MMAANLKILKDIFKEHEINRRTIVFFSKQHATYNMAERLTYDPVVDRASHVYKHQSEA